MLPRKLFFSCQSSIAIYEVFTVGRQLIAEARRGGPLGAASVPSVRSRSLRTGRGPWRAGPWWGHPWAARRRDRGRGPIRGTAPSDRNPPADVIVTRTCQPNSFVRRSARCLPPSVSVSPPGTTPSFHRFIETLFKLAYFSFHSLINTSLRLSDVPRVPEPGATGRPKRISGLSHRPTDDRSTPTLKSPELSS